MNFVRNLVMFRRFSLWLAVAASVSLTAAEAAFNAQLQGQSFGSTNWSAGNVTGWAELDLIPMRVYLTGGPAIGRTITVKFDHTKTQGDRILRGIQNLYNFTPSPNVVITSGPTLDAPPGEDVWSYTFTINLTNSQPGFVEFRARLAAGAHNFPGSSLVIGGSPSLGNVAIHKPAASPGAPDLVIVKTGPASANPGATIHYSISYQNKLHGTAATGVQIFDVLPPQVTFLGCSGGCEALGNTVTWDLGDLPRGASGVVTYQVAITNAVTTGFSFHNNASIASAENDLNDADNFSSVTTVVTSNCVPPSVVLGPQDAAVCAGGSVTFAVLANGSAPLQYQWRKDGANIPGATTDTLTLNSVTAADSGHYDVVISNLCGSATSATATLTVLTPPAITAQPADATVCAGDAVTLSVVAEGTGPLTYQWRKDGTDIAGATNASYGIAAATVADAGAYDVVVSGACGPAAVSAAATVVVKSLPVASPDSYAATEDALLLVSAAGVLGNDTDADADALSATLVAGPSHGSLNLNADGSFSYMPAPDYHGPDSFTYRAEDDCGHSGTVTVSISVAPVNDPPVAAPDSYATVEDTALSIAAPGVLGNDSDVDGDALSAVLVSGPAHGELALNADGSFSYTPAANFHGTDSFSYRASDGAANSAPVTVTITVSELNDPPVAVDDALAIAEDSGSHTIHVLANDSDVDGDPLTVISAGPAGHGTVVIGSGGLSVSYTPNVNFQGSDAFSYTVSDGRGGTATASVQITVTPVNDPPVAMEDAYSVAEDDVLEVAAPGVLANDSDPEGAALTAALVSGPAHGSLTLNPDGSFTYVPEDNFSGTDSFSYRASDGALVSSVATVHITVTEVSGAGDIDLYIRSASARINWARHAQGAAADTLALRGRINPRGIKDDLTGATIAVQINGVDVLPPQVLDASGVAAHSVGSMKVAARLRGSNGAYAIKVTGLDLRGALGLANATESGATVLTVRLTINGAELDIPVTTARIESPYRSTAEKSSALKFSFRKHRTLSGVFNSNKTTAAQKGQVTVTLRGVLLGEGGVPVVPAGNVGIHMSNAALTVPMGAIVMSGTDARVDAQSVPLQGSSQLRQFTLLNSKRTFTLSIVSGDIALPPADPNGPLSFRLPVLIEVQTASGPVFLESIIELKRSSPTSTRWKR